MNDKSNGPKIRFTDGVEFNMTGPYRVEWRKDGYYVVGQGFLCPVDSREEGEKIIAQLSDKK